jgi:hypothetical protein
VPSEPETFRKTILDEVEVAPRRGPATSPPPLPPWPFRLARLTPTEWVLCDIHIHSLINGYAQGVAFLWSQDGDLLATASQSSVVHCGPTRLVRRSESPHERGVTSISLWGYSSVG